MTTYLGIDVLERQHNAVEEPSDTLGREYRTLDPGVGKRFADAADDAGATGRTFLWTCPNRAEIVALKTWLRARKGRTFPFWMPSWRRDLILASTVQSVDTVITIQNSGYTRYLWANPARRDVAFILGPSQILYRRITAVAEQGLTETLTLSSSLGVQIPTSTLVSFLAVCRLDTDEPELVYHTDSIAEARLPFIEIPMETP